MSTEREEMLRSETREPDELEDVSVRPEIEAEAAIPPPPQGATEEPRVDEPTEPPASASEQAPLLAEDRTTSFRARWEEIQVRFVDEPRSSVEQADHLVTEVIDQLQASFTSERGRLEGQWQQGGDPSTEDLRVALQRYRSFFDRLLAA